MAYLAQQLCGYETAEIIFVLKPLIFTKNLDSLFNTVLCQDGLICDDVGWWGGFNKGRDIIYSVDIGLFEIV